MRNDNMAYGGFIISKNILSGKPVRFSYREKSNRKELNGWTIYSCDDDEHYISNPDNFLIVGEKTIKEFAPKLLEIFNAPFGTDLCWLYEEFVPGYIRFIGFFDLKENREITIKEILGD